MVHIEFVDIFMVSISGSDNNIGFIKMTHFFGKFVLFKISVIHYYNNPL